MKVFATKRQAGSLDEVDQLFSTDHLRDLLKNSDYVVNVLPVTAETQGMMGCDQFRAMRPASYFINVGRGRTV
jgi:D-2-hydroxyacid dehydrogenase (NADP+)